MQWIWHHFQSQDTTLSMCPVLGSCPNDTEFSLNVWGLNIVQKCKCNRKVYIFARNRRSHHGTFKVKSSTDISENSVSRTHIDWLSNRSSTSFESKWASRMSLKVRVILHCDSRSISSMKSVYRCHCLMNDQFRGTIWYQPPNMNYSRR